MISARFTYDLGEVYLGRGAHLETNASSSAPSNHPSFIPAFQSATSAPRSITEHWASVINEP